MNNDQLVLHRGDLECAKVNIQHKALLIAFNEPRFKKSTKDKQEGDIDAKLNARFPTYFLPAVELARQQNVRPRLFVISALNMALSWNAQNDEQRSMMIANNSIKIDFLKQFFEKFFPEDFSLIEYIIAQDTLKVSEEKFLALWRLIESKHADELREVRFQFTKFLYPKEFNMQNIESMDEKQRKRYEEVDITPALKYAIAHLFVMADVNFEGNYVHPEEGYVSIGGEAEYFFNIVRKLAFTVVKDYGELIFDRPVQVFHNERIIIENDFKVPPPYNGMYDHKQLLEVTYENQRDISFYDEQEKLRPQMEYMYEHLIPQKDYSAFWNEYKDRYFALKERYREAYGISDEW